MASKPALARAERRTAKLDLRVPPSAKAMIHEAAASLGRDLSDFVLEAALSRAQETLSERVIFRMSAENWTTFMAALDAPVRSMPRMQKLLTEPGYFDADNDR